MSIVKPRGLDSLSLIHRDQIVHQGVDRQTARRVDVKLGGYVAPVRYDRVR